MFAAHSLSGVQGPEYDSGADQSLLVSVQIESRSGVENVEEIAKVDGLDALLIGKCTCFMSVMRLLWTLNRIYIFRSC